MKQITLLILIIIFFTTVTNAGFFNESNAKNKAEFLENDRLCKVFAKKVEIYKKNLRDDLLATVSLASYEHRKDLFCKRAEESKKELDFNETIDSNLTIK